MGQQRRSLEARNRRVEQHLRLVEPLVRHYSLCTAEQADDLRQVALEGLIRAAERYNGRRAVPFAAFARPHIRGALLHYLRDFGHLIRIPRRVQEQRDANTTTTLRRVPYDRAVEETMTAEHHPSVGNKAAEVAELLQGLSPPQRWLVVRVVLRGESLRAVAQAQGTSASTVHRHLRQALNQLRPLVCPAFDVPEC